MEASSRRSWAKRTWLSGPDPLVVRSRVWSCIRTGTPSAVKLRSSSTPVAPFLLAFKIHSLIVDCIVHRTLVKHAFSRLHPDAVFVRNFFGGFVCISEREMKNTKNCWKNFTKRKDENFKKVISGGQKSERTFEGQF